MQSKFMMAHRHYEKAGTDRILAFSFLGVLLFGAPLIRGGNRQVALSGLLALALLVAACLFVKPLARRLDHGRKGTASGFAAQPAWWKLSVWILILAPLWLGALQLTPLPTAWWASLAGRANYVAALAAAGIQTPAYLPISLNSQATWAALWAGVPMSVAFGTALVLKRPHLDSLMAVLLAAGIIQVLMAVAQFGSGGTAALYFGLPPHGLIGTFANRNHLADFLAMLLPLWTYVWLRLQRGTVHWRGERFDAALSPIWLLLGFSFIVVILGSQSRGGIAAMALVLLLSAAFYGRIRRRHMPRWQRWALVGILIALIALALTSIVSAPIQI